MSTLTKRAREQKKARKAREKALRRQQKRDQAPAEAEIVSQEEFIGAVASTEEVLEAMNAPDVPRSAAAIPSKLFVGSLSDHTTSASLRAHFEADFDILEATVITDRSTGASRNFGFVTAADRRDTAKIIQELQHSELDGHSIVVRIATER